MSDHPEYGACAGWLGNSSTGSDIQAAAANVWDGWQAHLSLHGACPEEFLVDVMVNGYYDYDDPTTFVITFSGSLDHAQEPPRPYLFVSEDEDRIDHTVLCGNPGGCDTPEHVESALRCAHEVTRAVGD